jgi:hypothetical protein
MKKILSLISILILISMSACSDGGAGSIGPNVDPGRVEDDSNYRHEEHAYSCTERYHVDGWDNVAHKFGEPGRCPNEYMIHCVRYATNKGTEQEKYKEPATEQACNYNGGLDDGEIH